MIPVTYTSRGLPNYFVYAGQNIGQNITFMQAVSSVLLRDSERNERNHCTIIKCLASIFSGRVVYISNLVIFLLVFTMLTNKSFLFDKLQKYSKFLYLGIPVYFGGPRKQTCKKNGLVAFF